MRIKEMKSFIFIGGDKRMIYAAEKLSENYDCALCGFDGYEGELPVRAAEKNDEKFDIGVLPLPTSRDGENVCCPFGKAPINLAEAVRRVKKGGVILTGREFPLLRDACIERSVRPVDYFRREELAIMNAVPSAEGAVAAVINEAPFTVHGANILILGYGRIGKLTARYLSALGGKVTVAARKYPDLAWIRAYGAKAADIRANTELEAAVSAADIIINTVPAPILDGRLGGAKKGALLIELASTPCLSDISYAGKAGVRLIPAPGLPGKTAPITAGYIIADTIENLINENVI